MAIVGACLLSLNIFSHLSLDYDSWWCCSKSIFQISCPVTYSRFFSTFFINIKAYLSFLLASSNILLKITNSSSLSSCKVLIFEQAAFVCRKIKKGPASRTTFKGSLLICWHLSVAVCVAFGFNAAILPSI